MAAFLTNIAAFYDLRHEASPAGLTDGGTDGGREEGGPFVEIIADGNSPERTKERRIERPNKHFELARLEGHHSDGGSGVRIDQHSKSGGFFGRCATWLNQQRSLRTMILSCSQKFNY